jgi:iron complex transport system substrate-binding protein
MVRLVIPWLLVFFACLARAEPPAVPAYLGQARPKAAPRRVVSLAPSLTEIVFALGAGERVVGVTRFDDYPPAVLALPRVGGFTDPSLEAILGLQPDLVLCVPNAGNRPAMEAVVRLGVPVLVLPAERFEDVFQAVDALGRELEVKPAAEALIARLRARVAEVEVRVAGRARPRVLLVYGHKPLVAAGPGTFADEMIRLAGGRNVLEVKGPSYPTLPMEEVLALAPEVILDAAMSGTGSEVSPEEARQAWSRWKVLPAVSAGRVHVVDSAVWFRPGPRIVDGLEQLEKLLHPAGSKRP